MDHFYATYEFFLFSDSFAGRGAAKVTKFMTPVRFGCTKWQIVIFGPFSYNSSDVTP